MRINIHNQDGVTLLISILVMSGLALISLAVGAFTIQEIRSSRATSLTEPAIAAAESGGEQAMWKIKRQINVNELNTCPTLTGGNLGNNTRSEVCRAYGPAIVELSAGVAYDLYLYDPEDINGNLCMNDIYTAGEYTGCSGAALYTNVTFERLNGTQPVQVSVTSLSGAVVGSSNGTTGTITISDPIAGSTDDRVRITISSAAAATVEVNGLPLGVPDRPIIRSHGCSSKGSVSGGCSGSEIFNRRIDISVQ